MDGSTTDLQTVLTTAHPARPYLIFGGAMCLLGLMRNNIGSLILMVAGGAVVAKGLEEVRRIDSLHDGNVHGTNAPPLDA